MSCKVVQGDETEARRLFNLKEGVTWEQVAAILNLLIDEARAVQEKRRKYVNSWVARKFGRGNSKKVYSVWSARRGMRLYKRIEYMGQTELEQALEQEKKNRVQAANRSKLIERRIIELETMQRIKPFDFGSEFEGTGREPFREIVTEDRAALN